VINRSSDQPINRSSDQPINRSSDQVPPKKNKPKPHNLTERQYLVLEFIYHNRPFKIHGPNGLGNILRIGSSNIRNQIKSLINKGFIYKPYSINDGVNVGSTCHVIEKKCRPLFGNTEIINPPIQKEEQQSFSNRSSDQLINRSSDQLINRSSDQLINSYNSSSSLFKKTTTIQNCESETEKILNEVMSTDPEYSYWIDQQVTPKQISAWKQEFSLDLQTIMNNLCYVRWQIVHQKVEIKKGPAQFIYGIMKKNGGMVNRPAGYKSMSQMDLDFFENWKKQRVEKAQQIERLKAEAVKKEIEPKITAILAQPDLQNEYFRSALEHIYSPKRKQTIIRMIEEGKPLDKNTESALRGYLDKILTEEAVKGLNF
jgi:hypothetical protein